MFSIVLRRLRGLTQKQEFSRHTDPYQVIGNHILQFLAKFLRKKMQYLEVTLEHVDFWPFLTTNPPLIRGIKNIFSSMQVCFGCTYGNQACRPEIKYV